MNGDIDGISRITLKDDVENYEKILIVGQKSDQYRTVVIYPKFQSQGHIEIDFSNDSISSSFGCNFTISGNILNVLHGWGATRNQNTTITGAYAGGNEVHITKVVGIK